MLVNNIFNLINKFGPAEDQLSAGFGFILKNYPKILMAFLKKLELPFYGKILKITDKDIEEAVLDGADTFEKVQQKTKVGIKDKTCIPEVEQLIRFYKEKYFG